MYAGPLKFLNVELPCPDIVVVVVYSLSRMPFFCDPRDCSSAGSSVREISKARILDWVAIFFSGDLPDPGIKPAFPDKASGFFTTEPSGKPFLMLLLQKTEDSLGNSSRPSI